MPLPRLLTRALAAPLDWIAPRTCAACDASLRRGARVFCASCAATEHVPFDGEAAGLSAYAAGAYVAALSASIQRFKYGGRADLAPQLADLVCAAVADKIRHTAPLLVPVPLHPLKLAERGYNQSALLARAIARQLALPCDPLLLARTRHTAAQASRSRAERLTQLDGAFAVRGERSLVGRRVALVDDVLTTGATAAACTGALHRAGAEVVAVLAIARTEQRGETTLCRRA